MKLSRSKAFGLEKMYFDCIDEYGNCFILYWATLEICYLKFNYSGLLFSDSNNATVEDYSFERTPKPLKNQILSVDWSVLNIEESWERIDDPIVFSLYKDTKNRELIWDCHHPKVLAEIKYKGKTFKGYGYTETLFLSIKPWKLPFERLRWGRFLSEHCTIIWIRWEGTNPLNRLWYNGKEYNDGIFFENRVEFNKGYFVLSFQTSSTLRNTEISNVLPKLHILRVMLNKCLLNGKESKYKAKTAFSEDGKFIEDGWSLFETVTWKR